MRKAALHFSIGNFEAVGAGGGSGQDIDIDTIVEQVTGRVTEAAVDAARDAVDSAVATAVATQVPSAVSSYMDSLEDSSKYNDTIVKPRNQFPNPGLVDVLYIDSETGTQYIWDPTAVDYVPIVASIDDNSIIDLVNG